MPYFVTIFVLTKKIFCLHGNRKDDLITRPSVYKESQKLIFKHKHIRILPIQTISSPANQYDEDGKKSLNYFLIIIQFNFLVFQTLF